MLPSQTGTRAHHSRGTTLIPDNAGHSVRYDQKNTLAYTRAFGNGRQSRLPYIRCSAFRLQLRRDFPTGILARLSPLPGSLTGMLRRTRLHQGFFFYCSYTALCHTGKLGSMTSHSRLSQTATKRTGGRGSSQVRRICIPMQHDIGW